MLSMMRAGSETRVGPRYGPGGHVPGNLCVIPMQDWLRRRRARINTPSTTGKNWVYADRGAASPELAAQILE